MSKQLVQLLKVDERRFRSYIERLERLTQYPSIDIKLGLDIRFSLVQKVKQLGIESTEVDSSTLFNALKLKITENEQALMNKYKMQKSSSYLIAHKIAILATKISKGDKTLCMTSAGCKRVLLAVPPKRTMRLLKVRSLQSVLKREDPRILYVIAMYVEDNSWRSQIHAKIKRLQTKDFAWLTPESATLPKGWFDKLENHLSGQGLILKSPENGFALLLPLMNKETVGSITYALCSLLQSLAEFSAKSMAYLNEGLANGYHDSIIKIAHTIAAPLEPVHGMLPSWEIVYEQVASGQYTSYLHDVNFVISDLQWQSLEMKLASIIEDYSFWVGTHYLGLITGKQRVSLHIMDVTRNMLVPAREGILSTRHLENSLWNELNARYLKQEAIEKKVISQLRAEEAFVL
jgi:hypothetical protein